VDSCVDALIHKASIAFKIQTSGHQSAWYTHASDMKIACIKSIVRTTILLVWTHEAFIWKLLAAEVRPSGRHGTTIRTRLKNRKEFQQNSREVDCTVVHPDGP
jgi:hypothetical protein